MAFFLACWGDCGLTSNCQYCNPINAGKVCVCGHPAGHHGDVRYKDKARSKCFEGLGRYAKEGVSECGCERFVEATTSQASKNEPSSQASSPLETHLTYPDQTEHSLQSSLQWSLETAASEERMATSVSYPLELCPSSELLSSSAPSVLEVQPPCECCSV